jgi:hypothetical protein
MQLFLQILSSLIRRFFRASESNANDAVMFYIREEDVKSLLTIEICVEALEEVYKALESRKES